MVVSFRWRHSQMWSVVQLGVGFLLIFTAFNSCSMIQEVVLESLSASNETDVSVGSHAGYYSLSIIYASLTLCNLVAPVFIRWLTGKWSMVIGGLIYSIFLASFLIARTVLLYMASALLGFGAAIIWVGQGNYLTLSSDKTTIGRNSGVVWAVLQCSLPLGGIFLYTQFRQNSGTIPVSTIRLIYICFTSLALAGTVILALLRPVKSTYGGSDTPQPIVEAETGGAAVDATLQKAKESQLWMHEFVGTFKLLRTFHMLLLTVVFVHTGFLLTFWSGIYGTSLAYTLSFSVRTQALLALNSIFIGFGETFGGSIFGLFGKQLLRNRNPVIILGTVANYIAFFLIFITIPPLAVKQRTDAISYIRPNEYVALFCSFLLGFGDSCWNTQIYSILGSYYAGDSAKSFALYKFFQSLAAAIGFYYGSLLTMPWQLLILTCCGTCATFAFMKAEWIAEVNESSHRKPH